MSSARESARDTPSAARACVIGLVANAETFLPHEVLSYDGLASARAANGPADLHDATFIDVAEQACVVKAELSDRTLVVYGAPGRPVVGFYIVSGTLPPSFAATTGGGITYCRSWPRRMSATRRKSRFVPFFGCAARSTLNGIAR